MDKKDKTLIEFKLRRWEDSDAESCAEQANNVLVSRYLRDVFPCPYSVDDAKQYINFCHSADPKKSLFYCIDVGGRAVGSISVSCGVDVHRKSAELGYWLGRDYWGHGIASRAVKQICAEAFEKFDIIRIHAEVFAPNKGSQAVLTKNGFMQEGVLHSSVVKNDTVMDEIIFALVKS